VLFVVSKAIVPSSFCASKVCNVVNASLLKFMGETWRGEGKAAKKEAAKKAPVIMMITISISIVRIMLSNHSVTL
jgi:hypothetical protein